MPELPEVECLRRTLEPALAGASIAAALVRRRGIVEVRGAAGLEASRERSAPMRGAAIARIERHGKELAIVEHGERRALRVRLGMTGGLRVEPWSARPAPLPHEHVRWTIESPSGRLLLRHADPRRFGDLAVFCDHRLLVADRGRLGPDGLLSAPTALSASLSARLARTRRALKVALLDQSLVAGLGNIYADESLFAAGLSPLRPACSLKASEVGRLTEAIVKVLGDAVEAGGSTLRDYRDALGRRGAAQDRHQVYGRGQAPCFRCGTELQGTRLGGRITSFCGRCQQ